MYCQKCGNALAPGARFCNACGTPVPEAAAAKKSGSGVIVAIVIAVVVLFVVVFGGIIAAIAIPNFLTAKQRAMQRRTIADMRRVTMNVEVYRQEHNAFPDTIDPVKDAWGNNLRYKNDGTNYWIVSAGKDGRFEEDDPSRYTAGTTTNFDADIVMENGEMLRAPAGVTPRGRD